MFYAPLLTHRMWETKGGEPPLPFARPLTRESKDQSGRPCMTTTRTFIKRRKVSSLEKTKKGTSAAGRERSQRQSVGRSRHTNCNKVIQTRAEFKLNLWAIHQKSRTAAQATALECLDQGESAPSETSEWQVRSFGFPVLLLPSVDGRFVGRRRESDNTRSLRQVWERPCW